MASSEIKEESILFVLIMGTFSVIWVIKLELPIDNSDKVISVVKLYS